MPDDIRRAFRARLTDVMDAQRLLDEGAKIGEAQVQIAAFAIPDTHAAVGNEKPQVIDQGAFRGMIETRDFATNPMPLFLDHGDYIDKGYTDSRLKIGRADTFKEFPEGLTMRGYWNLEKQVAREAFSDIVFDPYGIQFSFRNFVADEVSRDGDDGFEHITEFKDLVEVSQVPFGAQSQTGVLAGTITARAAIASHSTATYEASWNGPAAVRALSNDAGATVFRRMFAWVDPDSDPAAKASYKFPHHTVEDGRVGGANVTAARAIISNLNGARGGSSIPDGDRAGVYRHAARHLSDANVTPAPLRALMPDADALTQWAEESEDFREVVRQIAEEYKLTPADGSVKVDVQLTSAEALKDPEVLARLVGELRLDKEYREVIRAAIAESEKPNAVTEFMQAIWKERAGV